MVLTLARESGDPENMRLLSVLPAVLPCHGEFDSMRSCAKTRIPAKGQRKILYLSQRRSDRLLQPRLHE
jgi:hypothetical protein